MSELCIPLGDKTDCGSVAAHLTTASSSIPAHRVSACACKNALKTVARLRTFANSGAESLKTEFLSPVSSTVCCCPVAQSCPTLCDHTDCSTPGLPVHHQLPELAQTHVRRVGGAIQPSHPLSSPSPPTFNLSQHQGLFQ